MIGVKTVFFDVCGTLVNVNTTFDFVKYYHLKRKHLFRYLALLLVSGLLGKVLERFFSFSIRKFVIKSLKGEYRADIDLIASIYVEKIFKVNKIEKIFGILSDYRDKPELYEVVLISASIDPVIKAMSERINVRFFSSKLKVDDEMCVGTLETDLKGNKKKIVTSESNRFAFYSDNLDDLDCASYVVKYFYINKKRRELSFLSGFKNLRVINV